MQSAKYMQSAKILYSVNVYVILRFQLSDGLGNSKHNIDSQNILSNIIITNQYHRSVFTNSKSLNVKRISGKNR